MKQHVNYQRNVFINCPFDSQYDGLLNAVNFTVQKCGFLLRCAKEFEGSSNIRISNIIRLINESKYAIHDLSRVTVDVGELPRFNMPLELGIFIGCKEFGVKRHREKEYLILESERFRYQKFISDVSGQDIQAHEDKVENAVKHVRNWLASKSGEKLPSHSLIFKEYLDFQQSLPDLCARTEWVPEELTFSEYSLLINNWLALPD